MDFSAKNETMILFSRKNITCARKRIDGKRLRVYTIVDFSFIRTFAPSF